MLRTGCCGGVRCSQSCASGVRGSVLFCLIPLRSWQSSGAGGQCGALGFPPQKGDGLFGATSRSLFQVLCFSCEPGCPNPALLFLNCRSITVFSCFISL